MHELLHHSTKLEEILSLKLKSIEGVEGESGSDDPETAVVSVIISEFFKKNAAGLAEFSPCGRIYAVVPGNSGSDFDDVAEFSAVFDSAFTQLESPSRAA